MRLLLNKISSVSNYIRSKYVSKRVDKLFQIAKLMYMYVVTAWNWNLKGVNVFELEGDFQLCNSTIICHGRQMSMYLKYFSFFYTGNYTYYEP